MTKAKNLGIWMDHSSANLLELTAEPIEIKTISSDYTHDEKSETLSKSENIMHNKEQAKQSDFYKKLMEEIRNYENVLIFGPTNAKAELNNLIAADHRFADIKIEVKSADKMSDHDQKVFVKDHFSKR